MSETKDEHILRLSSDLLEDIGHSRLGVEALLLKAMRLARLTGSNEAQKWLRFELSGYNTKDPKSLEYMARTGRWISRDKQTGYWGPLAQQEATIDALKLRLQSLTTQGLGGEAAAIAINMIARNTDSLTQQLTWLSGIKGRVLGLLHSFVASVYYEGLFSRTAESIFEAFRADVDPLLRGAATDLPERMATSYERLLEGDREAISAALNTCRRVIDAFADVVFPPRDVPFQLDGQTFQVGPPHHQNRINAFVSEKTVSKNRRKRLRQALSNLYDRVCAGIHDDVSIEEAKALVLTTYLLLGEISTLTRAPQAEAAEPTV